MNLCQQDVVEGILNMDMAATQSDDFLHYASGGRLFAGSVPLAHRYGGHQVQLDTYFIIIVNFGAGIGNKSESSSK